MFDEEEKKRKLEGLINEKILKIDQQTDSFSNIVYSIKTPKSKYIYKEHLNLGEGIEKTFHFRLQNQIGVPKFIFAKDSISIEEYIEHTRPDWREDLDEIATSLRNFHSIQIESSKNAVDICFFDSSVKNILEKCSGYTKIVNKIQEIVKDDMKCLCHNDLQLGNILKADKNIIFIDFEYSGINSPWIDIANLFCETMADYKQDSILIPERGYNRGEKIRFLQNYTRSEKVDRILQKVEDSSVWSHWFWYTWAKYMIQKLGSNLPPFFNYREYGSSRLKFLVDMGVIFHEEAQQLEDVFEAMNRNW